ncbi:Ser/Thr protein kinase RdoA involved in Cpx stress response, MazF antagonist [Actinopolymorpha cephalotaxi]|uniref:Ser/Thr protein kinase RdoA (MazF antagonist) n=1 Tax=Actinopolymorpha cephalotaxi TaxID=504797 RepID=A0A1I3BWB4_9ACTN|nr:phosphotransferase [Actinopolymorpha cephalotaxi]NYH86320.1 Ser/Thr protein kinase RdoA (MazF antagonist) [Actinopolymorpha cephalotaxi]SFH66523.1 Ser/Thr protein kinase RdoA involved in Cpx stress response, MazF antagonist [Actinopolymorpha cephalotaxi]
MTVREGGFAMPGDSDVQRLAAKIVPGGSVIELGGFTSRNLRLGPVDGATDGTEDLVLRIHPKYVSRRRLVAVQEVRRQLADMGLAVPRPLPHAGSAALRCAFSWAELEPYMPYEELKPTWDSYPWMFQAMGQLQRALVNIDAVIPRPVLPFFAAPSTLQRWLTLTRTAVGVDSQAIGLVDTLHDLIKTMRRQWVPTAELPGQIVHGDINLENVGRAQGEETVYLDFACAANRPRIHDLAFSFGQTVFTHAEELPVEPSAVPWERVAGFVEEYENAAGWKLTAQEGQALTPYTVAVMLFFPAGAWLDKDPAEWLRRTQPFQQFSEWLLAHPEALSG